MAGGNLSKDQERLAKLWDAYEVQEKELELSMKKISTLERKVEEFNRVNDVLKKALEDRDKEIRDLELKVIRLEEDNSKFQPQINDLEKLYTEEKERYAKLFTITEELEDDLAKAKKEIEVKDKWFNRNVGMLENIRESIVQRNVILDSIDKVSDDQLDSSTKISDFGNENTSEEPAKDKKVEEITFGAVSLDSKKEVKNTSEDINLEIPLKVPEETKPESEPETKPESASTPAKDIVPKTIEQTVTETQKPSRNDTIYEFTKIDNVDTEIAEMLYNGGFTSIAKLKAANTQEIAKIEGISPTLARKIRTSLFEMTE